MVVGVLLVLDSADGMMMSPSIQDNLQIPTCVFSPFSISTIDPSES